MLFIISSHLNKHHEGVNSVFVSYKIPIDIAYALFKAEEKVFVTHSFKVISKLTDIFKAS